MKRVLLITYYYPPRPGIGSVRPGGLAKYLPEFGWEPLILTPRLPDGPRPPARVIQTGYRDVLGDWKAKVGLDAKDGLHEQLGLPVSSVPRTKRLHTCVIAWAKSLVAYPDPMKGWIPFATQALQNLGRHEKVDAILSTAHPVSCHIIGRRAKEILGCPWVADFRDLWTQNAYYPYGRVRRTLEGYLEGRTVGCADALTTVSAPLAQLLKSRFSKAPIYWITNGFDPEDYPPEPLELTKTFTITYTGQLYQGKRDPGVLFDVIGELLREGAVSDQEVRLRFYGPAEPWMPALLRSRGVNSVVEIHGPVPRDTALKCQRESQLLLLISWNDPAEAGIYTGKIFEYLGSKRPIIALGGPEGVVKHLLEETGAGTHVRSREQLRGLVIEAYREFQTRGCVSYRGDESVIGRYTHRQMAKNFSAVLDTVTGGTRNGR